MAILLVEGFDHETTADLSAKGWFAGFYSFVTGRFSQSTRSAGVNVIANNGLSHFFTPSSTVIVGFAFEFVGPNTVVPMQIYGLGTHIASVDLDFANRLVLRNAAGTALATGTLSMLANVWNYIEVEIVIGTSGTGEVHVNGAVEIASTVGNFGTTNADEIVMEWGGNALSNANYDDIYVADGTGGSPNNTFLGDVRVETLYPASDGTHLDWTPDTGVAHYSRVNEAQIDGDTSYVYATNAGSLDSYHFQPLTNAGTVFAAQVNLGVRKNDAILRQVAPLIRQGGVDYVGGTFTINGSYQFWSQLYNTDPTGSGWTVASIDNDEYGIKLIA